MLTSRSNIFKLLFLLPIIFSLCDFKVESISMLKTFRDFLTSWDPNGCSFWEKYILWSDCDDEGLLPSCTYFQRFLSWDSECSPSIEKPYYSRCTKLEAFVMKKKYCEYIPESFLDVAQIIARYGYKSETHNVITNDGYILELHRIPNIKKQSQPVFLQHGLFGSSADFLLNGKDSLAFLLSNLGYDVWMGNSRGNTYSNAHVDIPNHNPAFWNFTFHEMGINDMDKSLLYISYVTKMPGEVIYIGYSTGATLAFIYASTMPVSEKIIKLIITIGPFMYPSHFASPLKSLISFMDKPESVVDYIGTHQFLPSHNALELLSEQCQSLNVEKVLCDHFVFSIFGYNVATFNAPMLPLLLSKMPSGVSTKTIRQINQAITRGDKFERFDYGPRENAKKYGTKHPPVYDIGKIKVPVFIMYSMNDWFCNYTDVLYLATKLQNLTKLHKVDNPYFGHLDFLFGKHMLELVAQPILDEIKNYTNLDSSDEFYESYESENEGEKNKSNEEN